MKMCYSSEKYWAKIESILLLWLLFYKHKVSKILFFNIHTLIQALGNINPNLARAV